MKITYDQAKEISDKYTNEIKHCQPDWSYEDGYLQAVRDVLSVLGYQALFDPFYYPETLRIAERQGGYVY